MLNLAAILKTKMAAIFNFTKKMEKSSFSHKIHQSVQKSIKTKINSDFRRNYIVKLTNSYLNLLSISCYGNINSGCNEMYPVNTQHFYNMCTMLDQRRRRWADIVQMV